MRTSVAACKIACPQIEIDNFVLINKGLAINRRHLNNDYAKSFWLWTCATGCSTVIPVDKQ